MPVDAHVLAAFAAASFVLLVIPGPTIILVISQALAHGRQVALASVAGVGLGDLFAATLSLIGVGTVLAASATAFTVIKWIGAAYLVWIGVKMWRSPVTPPDISQVAIEADQASHAWPVFRDAFLVTLFNPKGIVFFLAFVPQFITPARAFAPQAAVLVVTFVILGMFNAGAYALLASSARNWIRRPSVLRTATRTGSLFLISAGIASVFVRRAA
jgi:threonine/homoserine/homoserine lactone efflux protein